MPNHNCTYALRCSLPRHTYLFAVGYPTNQGEGDDSDSDDEDADGVYHLFKHDVNQPHNASEVAVDAEVSGVNGNACGIANVTSIREMGNCDAV